MDSKPGQVCNRDGNCTYKGCKYVHLAQKALPKDPCKYGENCVKEDCKFGHPPGRQVGSRPYNGGPRAPQGRKQCRYGPNCTKQDTCGYLHDGPASDERPAPPPGVARGPRPQQEEAKAGTMTKFARDDEEHKARQQKPCFKGNECQDPECRYAHDPNVGPSRPPKKPCFKGRNCTNSECPYSHDVDAAPQQARPPRKQNPCFKGAACTKADCPYSHDPNAAPVQVKKACRSGPGCTKPGCPYNHDPNAADGENAGARKGDVLIRRADPAKAPADSDKSNCIVCTTETKTVLIKPCNHMTFCDKCVKSYDHSKGCPMCRGPIEGTEKIFI